VLLAELDVRLGGVRAGAEKRDAGLAELAPHVSDAARLPRAARRVVLGIEVEHHRPAPQGLERDVLAGVGLAVEAGGGAAGFWWGHSGALGDVGCMASLDRGAW